MTAAGDPIDEAEVVVIGGGPAGSVAAAKLADRGRDVLLIDQSGFPRDKPCGDGLTHHAVSFLQEHGLGDEVEAAQPIEDVRVMLADGRERRGFYKPWPQPPTYARAMPRRALDNGLFDLARARGVRFLRARVDRPSLTEERADGVIIVGPEARKVAARCVIAADGATSRTRRMIGYARERPGSHIYALRLYVTTELELEPLFDFYVPLNYEGGILAGYGWVFPIGPRRANIGVAYYEPPPGKPRARIRRVLESFIEDLEERARNRLGALSDRSKPIGAPIATQFSPSRCQLGSLILAGEAARVADALNGEGISFAMQSGEYAAEEADRYLSSGVVPAQGTKMARRFTRLGQDLTMPARLVAGAATGLRLIDGGRTPFLTRAGRTASVGPEDPALDALEPGARLCAVAPSCAEGLRQVNELLLDSLRTTFPFALETMHRELRARGAFTAAVVLAIPLGLDSGIAPEHVAAAAALEALGLVEPCYREVFPGGGSELGRLNNALAAFTGASALATAATCAGRASTEFADDCAELAGRIVEGLAAEAGEAPDVPSPTAYFDCLGGVGASLSALAARGAADLSERAHPVDGLDDVGRSLGAAWALASEIRELTVGNEIARRPPGAELREGRVTLPVIYAIEADPELADELEDGLDGPTSRVVLGRIRTSGALERAVEECRTRVDAALGGIELLDLKHPAPLRELASVCLDRIPGPTPTA